MREWFETILLDPWATVWCEVGELLPAPDDRVFFAVRMKAKGADSGAEIEQTFWCVYRITDEGVSRREAFRDREEALAAAGVGG